MADRRPAGIAADTELWKESPCVREITSLTFPTLAKPGWATPTSVGAYDEGYPSDELDPPTEARLGINERDLWCERISILAPPCPS